MKASNILKSANVSANGKVVIFEYENIVLEAIAELEAIESGMFDQCAKCCITDLRLSDKEELRGTYKTIIAAKDIEIAELKTKIYDIENHRGWEVCAKCEHRPIRGVCKYSDCTVKSFDWFKPKAQ